MDKFFLPTFEAFFSVRVHFAQRLVHFAHFQLQARSVGLGKFRVCTYPRKDFVLA